MFGGVKMSRDTNLLNKRLPTILIATPGKLYPRSLRFLCFFLRLFCFQFVLQHTHPVFRKVVRSHGKHCFKQESKIWLRYHATNGYRIIWWNGPFTRYGLPLSYKQNIGIFTQKRKETDVFVFRNFSKRVETGNVWKHEAWLHWYWFHRWLWRSFRASKTLLEKNWLPSLNSTQKSWRLLMNQMAKIIWGFIIKSASLMRRKKKILTKNWKQRRRRTSIILLKGSNGAGFFIGKFIVVLIFVYINAKKKNI